MWEFPTSQFQAASETSSASTGEKWGQTPFSHVLRLAGDHVAGKACHEDFDELEITTLPF